MFYESWLDEPVIHQPRISRWVLLYALLIALVLGTRLWDLGARVYCHDESIHAWESWKLANGLGYVHDPPYHGPFLYHVTALTFTLFGDTDATGRLATAIGGILIALSPWMFRRWLGRWGVLSATLLMALSPVLLARSRYIRHDHFAIVANLLLLWAILRYLEGRRPRDLYLAAAAVSWGLTTKETTFITYALYGVFLAGYALWQWQRETGLRLRSGRAWSALVALPVFDLIVVIGTLILPTASPVLITLMGRNPVDTSAEGIVLSTVVWLGMAVVAASIGLLWDRRRWLVCAGLFYLIFIPLFTSTFTNLQGFATGMVGQLGYWLSQQGVRRGSQPWFYYFLLLGIYEFAAVAIGLATMIYVAARALAPRRRAGPLPSPVPPVSNLSDSVAQVSNLRPDTIAQGSPLASPAPQRDPQVGKLVLQGQPQDVAQVPQLVHQEEQQDDPVRSTAVRPVLPAPFLPFIIWWFLGAVLLYTWAGEKMPWLTMHLVVPLDLLAGWGLARLWPSPVKQGRFDWILLLAVPLLLLFTLVAGRSIGQGSTLNVWGAYVLRWIAVLALAGWLGWIALRRGARRALRLAALSIAVTLLLLTVRVGWNVAYRHAALASEFLVYAQGSPDVARVARDMEALSYRLTGGLDIKVAYDEDAAWPFIWYLRNYTNAQYFRERPAEPVDADVIIVGEINERALAPLLQEDYIGRQYRLVWWPNEDWYKSWTLSGLRQQLATPGGRAAFWDVLWNRRYEFSLQDWPGHLVHTFTIYVRRDIALPLGLPAFPPPREAAISPGERMARYVGGERLTVLQ